ncbi:multidrug resistance-associated ABC transporter [Phanerochaete sordida]|uniref:Multidrug resistance-associated ABC transporter n=1 Tax=Phanerochaete sordida TaxID=48140 RepID=A0A9P3LBG4_9APHY|nr:multidrug resistance-associated ABC transporter [Phanerochaete sordida]
MRESSIDVGKPSPWRSNESLYIPVCAACLSLVSSVVRLVVHTGHKKTIGHSRVLDGISNHERRASSFGSYVAGLGGQTAVVLNMTRALSCLALLSLSIYSATVSQASSLLALSLCATYIYIAILGLLSVASTSLNEATAGHLTFVLLATWAGYVYRDIWPIATYYLAPADEGSALLWTNLALLTVGAVVVPLTLPRKYVPYDPQDPAAKPTAEQTCSLLSMMLFAFLDPVVLNGYRTPHLTVEQMPLLSDYEHMKNMSEKSSHYLDPLDSRSSRHIFWGLLRLYKWEHFELWLMLSLLVPATFLMPISVNRILSYLENGGVDAAMRPWFWIFTFVSGVLATDVISGRYMFVVMRVLVEAQSTLTNLIFEHALRIRLKADTDSSADKKADGKSGATAPAQTESVAEEEGRLRAESETTLDEGQSSTAESSTAITTKDKGGEKAAVSNDSSMVGKINNMISTDVNTLEGGQTFILVAWFTPLQIALSVLFLYVVLGWSALVGIGTMICLLFLPGFIATLSRKLQVQKMSKSDARVGVIAEVVGGAIRMIKLFGWEKKISERIDKKRQEELHAVRNFRILTLISTITNNLIPLVTMVVTFAVYSLAAKGELTASKVFSSMSVFQTLQGHFKGVTWSIPMCIQAKVSLDRITDFLRKTELLDSFTESERDEIVPSAIPNAATIGIREASFTWNTEQAESLTPGSSRRSFRLCIDDELIFKRGHINLIIGPTGSGKTSLLMALLGEMHYLSMGPNSYVNLPREGGVAYHAQESWVLNETIRNNIVFGAPFEQERYDKVIRQCALERDLALFDAGDETEVGEKGVTLSGGQKARLTLARAIYSNADILLLDDVLAALDVHTAQSVVEECFQGELVRGRTVILVTHNVALATPIAEFVVSLGTDGRITSQGTLSSALEKDAKLAAYAAKERSQLKKADETIDEAKPETAEQKATGKLTVAEEKSDGDISWSAMKLLLTNTADSPGLPVFWIVFMTAMLASRSASTLDSWVLGLWARQYELHDPSDVSVLHYLSLYVGVISTSVVFMALGYTVYMFGTLRASRIIHQLLVDTVLNATLRWLDKTPSSRIIARCTQDIASIDNQVTTDLYFLVDISCDVLLKFCAIIVISPIFAGPGAVLCVIGGLICRVYMKAQLAVKREMSNAKAPVIGHVGAAIAGLVSIRAYRAQQAFRQESYKRLDRLTLAARTYRNLNRWIAIRAEGLAGLFAASLAVYMVYGSHRNASDTGFSLAMAVGFSNMMLFLIRVASDFQVEGNSLERIHQYLVIEQEPKPTDSGVPPAYWPASGSLRVEKLSARYSEDGPKVLHDLSFEVKSGERVGIVGRTGSGKSSLTLALLRCIPTEGKIYFDGIPTDSVNLDALRSNITIIPQVPELLTGTLRENLDPFSQHDDAVLNKALRSAGLFSLQNESDEGRLTLDSAVASGGGNLSVGQRQIIALARAIVRQSKLLILDEATSAIDYDTDTVIQESLRKEVAKDVTLLTIAHRLQTIMDSDKIMVLDAGNIVEFGSPAELLQNKSGFFRSLVDASGDKDKLYAMTANRA